MVRKRNMPFWLPVLVLGCTVSAAEPDITLADFEGNDFGAWKAEGGAFGAGPLRDGSPRPIKLSGFAGKGLAGSVPGKETAMGTLLSPKFKIERKFINFLVWGERNLPATVGVELLVDGRVVRAAGATEMFDPTRMLHWRTWDVGELAGRAARIRVNDKSATGAIAVDQFTQSDAQKTAPSVLNAMHCVALRPELDAGCSV